MNGRCLGAVVSVRCSCCQSPDVTTVAYSGRCVTSLTCRCGATSCACERQTPHTVTCVRGVMMRAQRVR